MSWSNELILMKTSLANTNETFCRLTDALIFVYKAMRHTASVTPDLQ